jgi:acyl carrier protein
MAVGSDEQTINIEEQIRKFVYTNLWYAENGFDYPDDASFLEEGIIDSLGVMELVEFVKTSFGVEVTQSEVIPAHFDSVTKLSTFVRGKLRVDGSVP